MFCFTVYFYAYFYSVEAVAQSGLILLQPLHRELPFQKGDIVYIIRQVDQNWYEGEHHGRVGIFPQSYVEVCELFPVRTSALWMCCFFCDLLHSPNPCVCSSSRPQRKPSQRKASRCRCWNTGRPSPASTSQGTQWWRCPSGRCGVASLFFFLCLLSIFLCVCLCACFFFFCCY